MTRAPAHPLLGHRALERCCGNIYYVPGDNHSMVVSSVPGKLRVLVVDDDRAIQEVMIALLEDKGYLATPAVDGLDALEQVEQVEQAQPDVNILDYSMPRYDGVQLAHREVAHAGDYLYIPAGVPHVAVNRGAAPAVFIGARTDPNEQESIVLCPELDQLVP